jgi:hypothetical protein
VVLAVAGVRVLARGSAVVTIWSFPLTSGLPVQGGWDAHHLHAL